MRSWWHSFKSSVDAINKSCWKAGSCTLIKCRLCPTDQSLLVSMSGDRGQSGCRWNKSGRTEIKNILAFTPLALDPLIRLSSGRTISFRHHESSSLINHSGAFRAQHTGYQPLCISLAACVLAAGGGIFIFFFFFPGVTLCYVQRTFWTHSDNVSMKQSWSQAACVTSAGSSTFHIGCSTRTQKIGAAKSSINTACNGSPRFSSQLL